MLQDTFNRTIRYLRLSLTQACQMRCVYCRPDFHTNANAYDLTPVEFERVAEHLVSRHGVQKVRLTGGDPTARPELLEIISRIAGLRTPENQRLELGMTTNGLSLASHARDYAAAGLQRVNVSLDSLEAETFHQVTGVDALPRVLAGIEAALAAGLTPLKINCVVLRGMNDGQLPDLLQFAAARGLELRLIEMMPMGPLKSRWQSLYMPAAEIRKLLEPEVDCWRPLVQGAASARNYRVITRQGQSLTVGFITPMSCNFCANCDRLRITADGRVFPCLMDEPRGSLLSALRPTFNPMEFDQILTRAYERKMPEHPAWGHTMMTQLGG